MRMCNTLYETANVLKVIRNLHEVFPVYEKNKPYERQTIGEAILPVDASKRVFNDFCALIKLKGNIRKSLNGPE